ncbi:MAG: hypothetical protein MZW92_03445 [Comamonadaceae bacterium]|nr:hypothetical protein [Comamonadaceae bacterium]
MLSYNFSDNRQDNSGASPFMTEESTIRWSQRRPTSSTSSGRGCSPRRSTATSRSATSRATSTSGPRATRPPRSTS